jgi:hypothetical protein
VRGRLVVTATVASLILGDPRAEMLALVRVAAPAG